MEEKKDTKTGAIIGTIAAALLCGCPGLVLCIFGGLTATGMMPYEWTLNDQYGVGTMPSWLGFVMLCVALIFIAIPIVVGVLTLRKKKTEEAAVVKASDEPLPPPS